MLCDEGLSDMGMPPEAIQRPWIKAANAFRFRPRRAPRLFRSLRESARATLIFINKSPRLANPRDQAQSPGPRARPPIGGYPAIDKNQSAKRQNAPN
jgi:hypothetical protein